MPIPPNFCSANGLIFSSTVSEVSSSISVISPVSELVKTSSSLSILLEVSLTVTSSFWLSSTIVLISTVFWISSKEISSSIVELSQDSDITRVVFKDNGFASDSDKTNIKENLRTHNIDEFITI